MKTPCLRERRRQGDWTEGVVRSKERPRLLVQNFDDNFARFGCDLAVAI